MFFGGHSVVFQHQSCDGVFLKWDMD